MNSSQQMSHNRKSKSTYHNFSSILFQNAEPHRRSDTKRCQNCNNNARTNRQKYCSSCGQEFVKSTDSANRQFWTEIKIAGHNKVSQKLQDSITEGADINSMSKMYGTFTGKSGLMVAVEKQNEDIVRFLVDRPEIDVNLKGKNNTPALCIAARYGSAILELLLSVPNINVNCQTSADSSTPIMIAVRFNKTINVGLLLQKGIDLTLTDSVGNTVLTMPFANQQERQAQNVVQTWHHWMTSVVIRWRYITLRKRRRREKGLASYVSCQKKLPDELEDIIRGNL